MKPVLWQFRKASGLPALVYETASRHRYPSPLRGERREATRVRTPVRGKERSFAERTNPHRAGEGHWREVAQEGEGGLTPLGRRITACRRCPRLVRHRERTAREKRASYRGEEYWGKPVPGFGDRKARLLIIGLAPAAHGGNRTGRMFTGDGSASFLVPALYRAGFASRPESVARGDGLRLKDAWMTAVVRCAPPDNKPTRRETETCREWLIRECRLLKRVSAVLVLGRIAMDGFVEAMRVAAERQRRGSSASARAAGHDYPRMDFRHGAEYPLPCRFRRLFVSYHPSRQNTQTGRLTARMLDSVLRRIRRHMPASSRPYRAPGLLTALLYGAVKRPAERATPGGASRSGLFLVRLEPSHALLRLHPRNADRPPLCRYHHRPHQAHEAPCKGIRPHYHPPWRLQRAHLHRVLPRSPFRPPPRTTDKGMDSCQEAGSRRWRQGEATGACKEERFLSPTSYSMPLISRRTEFAQSMVLLKTNPQESNSAGDSCRFSEFLFGSTTPIAVTAKRSQIPR